MAIMIPSYYISENEKSHAEQKIFDWFKNAPGTDDWIVLHSLGIEKHVKLYYGETDFVVIVPSGGLFALEVKGGRVECNKGVWCYTNRDGITTKKERGPFEQAWQGMYSIREIIRNRLDENHRHLYNLLLGNGVMFPDITFDATILNSEQWRVFDERNRCDVKNYICNLSEFSREMCALKHQPFILLNLDDAKYISQILRPDFEFAISLNEQLRNTEEMLIALTNEEYENLDLLDGNDRCLIKGPAGTGKTFLAVEQTRRKVNAGKRVGLFCFNKNLGSWLEKHVHEYLEIEPIYVGSFHKYMNDIVRRAGVNSLSAVNKSDEDDFYKNKLPILAQAALIVSGAQFDELIIDEAQDILLDNYLNVLNKALVNGLENGCWMMFGDFVLQNIYLRNPEMDNNNLRLLDKRSTYAVGNLTRNCRNTESVCNAIRLVVNSPVLQNYRGRVKGDNVEHVTYKNKDDELTLLGNLLDELSEKRIKDKEISILSAYSYGNSIVSSIGDNRIVPYENHSDFGVAFSTIQSFKGLENEIIIVVDIDTYEEKLLAYVGMSRARSKLFLFESSKATKEFAYALVQSGGNYEG